MMWEAMQRYFPISAETVQKGKEIYDKMQEYAKPFRENALLNQWKVMAAFSKYQVSEQHLLPSTGYGYDDAGRDVIDEIWAEIFGCEDALVRHTFVNGTHAIATALYGVLRPGDTLLAATGKPYDTLEETIGGEGGSLKDYGVTYAQVDLQGGKPDLDAIRSSAAGAKAVLIQKSKGYDWRPSLSNEQIGEIIKTVKEVNPNAVCIVDNCYGEFVETTEPTQHGADLVCGSLIKNAGAGLVRTGGYIAGKKEYIELCANRLTAVGLGKHVGATLGMNREILQGLFMAPHIVSQALETALFCSLLFSEEGIAVNPTPEERRTDIIQALRFGAPEGVVSFCEGIQAGAPIDSFVTPVPWDMPGYAHQVIMAAGAFTQGASIELSADAPMREPYVAYMQGGLTFESGMAGILLAYEKWRRKV